MFRKKSLEELRGKIQERLKYKCYEPVTFTDNLPEVLKSLNGRIVLLQSEHLGKYFHRGKMSYDEKDPEVLVLKNYRRESMREETIHLHDMILQD